MNTFKILGCTLLLLCLVGQRCAPDLAGATTETTNGVTGKLLNSDNTPAAHSVVKLLPSDYNPMNDLPIDTAYIDTSDGEGNYRFDRIATGTYSLIARNRKNATSFLIEAIAVGADTVTQVSSGVLKRSGSITADFSQTSSATDGYVYIPGTDIAAPIASNGSMVLGDVPPGIIASVLFAPSNGENPTVLKRALTVVEDSTITIKQPLWTNSKRLLLNTARSGADVSEDLFAVTVLVRLDSVNFDFLHSATDGKDLVFTKTNGEQLSHEIERWSSETRRAEVWVHVDTLIGNDSTQSILLYWGNPAASVATNNAVFDSSTGYSGVWHLSENGSDATPQRNNATTCTPADIEGMIGLGKKFNGHDSIVIPSLFGTPQRVTLSAWARLDSMPAGAKGAEVVSIGDGCLLRMDDNEADTFGVSGSFHLKEELAFHHVCSGHYLQGSGWHYYVVAFDCINGTQDLYIDGELSKHTALPDTINYTGMGIHTIIGAHGNGKGEYNFIGVIDEVRIRKTAATSAAVKLDYMNQKANDALIKFDQ